MALAYTAPTWTDGSGEGLSASNLQAISNCIEGLVQGTDKAIHNIAINNGVMTITYVDGTVDTGIAVDMKGISSIAKTGTIGNVDTYTITFTNGSTFTYTITNGVPGTDTEAFHPTDDTEATLDDADTFPFYDVSADAPKETLWSNIKAKLKSYFDPIYKCLVVTASSVSSLPATISNAGITASMVCVKAELSNPSAQSGDWTVTTASGSATVSGTISGTTDITLYLMESR